MQSAEQLPPSRKVTAVTNQYRAVVGALDMMFAAARPRTEESWRSDDVGSCKFLERSRGLWNEGLIGPAADYLTQLRNQRSTEAGGVSTLTICPFHRADRGCVLGDLKSPICISFNEARHDWRERLKINPDALTHLISAQLEYILQGQALNNPDMVTEYIAEIGQLTVQIEQVPPLFPKEAPDYIAPSISLRGRFRALWTQIQTLPARWANEREWRVR